MKDDDLFWFISDFFEQFPPGHQLTIVAKHAFNREYAVNFAPPAADPPKPTITTPLHRAQRGGQTLAAALQISADMSITKGPEGKGTHLQSSVKFLSARAPICEPPSDLRSTDGKNKRLLPTVASPGPTRSRPPRYAPPTGVR